MCTIIGTLSGLHTLWSYAALERPIPIPAAITTGLLEWWLWALLYPCARVVATRCPLRSTPRLAVLGIWLLSSLVASFVQMEAFQMASALIRQVLYGHPFEFGSFAQGFRLQFPLGVAVWWAALLGLEAYAGFRRSHLLELRASEIRERLAQARIHALQIRLQPHFLFNTLNAITALVHADPRLAERMLTRLGELLRHILDAGDRPEVSLREELGFLEHYLEIQQIRCGSRLRATLDPDPATLAALLPTLLLQPILENAIVHGISETAGGAVRLRSGRTADRLWIEVSDDGAGPAFENAASPPSGHGLANTRQRLQTMYGSEHRLELTRSGSGTCVRLELPWRTPAEARG